MLGALIVVISLIGFAAGLEVGSPGTVKAIVHASVLVMHASTTHVGQQICTQLAALGDHSPACVVH